MPKYIITLVENYLVALGVILGGTIIGSLVALLSKQPPTTQALLLAERLKIWAMVTALGGTFETIRIFESSVLQGALHGLLRQGAYIVSAFLGAHSGYLLIRSLFGGPRW